MKKNSLFNNNNLVPHHTESVNLRTYLIDIELYY